MIVAGFEAVKSEFPELEVIVPSRPFPRYTMVEAKKILKEREVPSA